LRYFFQLFVAFLLCVPFATFSQGFTRKVYHDKEKKILKEEYEVRDTISNILNGQYISYYLNGNVESKGQFLNDETAGIWEFYYETGNLKMRGILKQGANHGLWEYFYESGEKSMEGVINGRNREGEWKTYYEDGQLKESGIYKANKRTGLWKLYYEDGTRRAETEYLDDFGRSTEYYHSGKVMGEGPKRGIKQVGHWRYFDEGGVLESEGEFEDGKRTGTWIFYNGEGKVVARGSYSANEPTGSWEYYYSDGTLNAKGEFVNGHKNGYWKALYADGRLKSEITYVNGNGVWKEFYPTGKLKSKGNVINDHREGNWEFYYEDGKLEGECHYENGKGVYSGYYPNGALQTKGEMEDDKKVGTWEIFESDGKLSGYYRPFYDNNKIGEEIVEMAGKSSINKVVSKGKHFPYFDPRVNEFKGVILGTNPIFVAMGSFPIGIEFYLEERLGHEFEFIGIRDPFFTSDQNIPPGKDFKRGYSVAIKQKFYNALKVGSWYFGHEIRFTNVGHFSNVMIPVIPDSYFTASAVEQRIEYGPLLGYRLMRRPNTSGWTIDAFISYNIGYRGFDVDPQYASYFDDINQSKFSNTFHFGLNFGNVFSFR
jgi:antitoxin component YwqK of YwqJK toxin-antitoxin module